jgi:hypothetical protein
MPTVTGQPKAKRRLKPLELYFGDLLFARRSGVAVTRDGAAVRVRTLKQVVNEKKREAAREDNVD